MPNPTELAALSAEQLNLLSQESDRLSEKLTELDEFIKTQGEEFTTKEQEAIAIFELFISRISGIQERFEADLQASVEGINMLQEKIELLDGGLSEFTETTLAQVTDLRGQAEGLLAEMEPQLVEIGQGFDDLTQPAQEFGTEVETLDSETVQSVETLVETVTAARDAFYQGRTDLTEEFGTLEKLISDRWNVLDQNFEALSEKSRTDLNQLVTDLETAKNKAVEDIGNYLAEAVGRQLSEETGKLGTAIEGIAEAGSHEAGQVDRALANIINKVVDVCTEIQELKPALENI